MKTLLFIAILCAVVALVWASSGTSLAAEKRICPFPGCRAEIKPDGSFTCGWTKDGVELRVCLKHGIDAHEKVTRLALEAIRQDIKGKK